MGSLKALGVGAFSLVLIIVVAFGGYTALSLNIGTVSGEFFLGALAVAVLLGAGWLTMQGLGLFGKPFMLAATIVLVGIVLHHRNPGIAHLVAASNASVSLKADRAANVLTAVHEVPCSQPFVGADGTALYWWSPQDDIIRCYDRPGHHPEGKGELAPVNDAVAQLIVRQQSRMRTPTVIPAPPAQHAEWPQLGETPIVR